MLERDDDAKEYFPDVLKKEDGPAEVYSLVGGFPKFRTDSRYVLIVKQMDPQRGVFKRVGIITHGLLKWYGCAKQTTLFLE